MMINDQTYLREESELNKLFAEAGWSEVPRPNELRIQKIEERALSERIVKDSINFVFRDKPPHASGRKLESCFLRNGTGNGELLA